MTDVLMYVENGGSHYVPLTDAAKTAFGMYVRSDDQSYHFDLRGTGERPHPVGTRHLTFETVTKEEVMAQMNRRDQTVDAIVRQYILQAQQVHVIGSNFFPKRAPDVLNVVVQQSKPSDESAGFVPMSKDPLGRLAAKPPIAPLPANALAWTGCGTAPMIEWSKK